MSDVTDTIQSDNVIDLTTERLIRHCDEAETEEEADIAEVLLDAYQSGDVLVEMVYGELLFSLPENQAPIREPIQ
jgi:hypothetical protein